MTASEHRIKLWFFQPTSKVTSQSGRQPKSEETSNALPPQKAFEADVADWCFEWCLGLIWMKFSNLERSFVFFDLLILITYCCAMLHLLRIGPTFDCDASPHWHAATPRRRRRLIGWCSRMEAVVTRIEQSYSEERRCLMLNSLDVQRHAWVAGVARGAGQGKCLCLRSGEKFSINKLK